MSLIRFHALFRAPNLVSMNVNWTKQLRTKTRKTILPSFRIRPKAALAIIVSALLLFFLSSFGEGGGGVGPPIPRAIDANNQQLAS